MTWQVHSDWLVAKTGSEPPFGPLQFHSSSELEALITVKTLNA